MSNENTNVKSVVRLRTGINGLDRFQIQLLSAENPNSQIWMEIDAAQATYLQASLNAFLMGQSFTDPVIQPG